MIMCLIGRLLWWPLSHIVGESLRITDETLEVIRADVDEQAALYEEVAA